MDESRWQGPIQSEYGYHLVLVTNHQPARLPPLVEVEKQVREDLRRQKKNEAVEASIAGVVSGYRVERAKDLQSGEDKSLALSMEKLP